MRSPACERCSARACRSPTRGRAARRAPLPWRSPASVPTSRTHTTCGRCCRQACWRRYAAPACPRCSRRTTTICFASTASSSATTRCAPTASARPRSQAFAIAAIADSSAARRARWGWRCIAAGARSRASTASSPPASSRAVSSCAQASLNTKCAPRRCRSTIRGQVKRRRRRRGHSLRASCWPAGWSRRRVGTCCCARCTQCRARQSWRSPASAHSKQNCGKKPRGSAWTHASPSSGNSTPRACARRWRQRPPSSCRRCGSRPSASR